MIVIIPKDKTRFWHIYLRFMLPLGVVALLFCGYGVFHYQTAESPPHIDLVLFRVWGTTFCIVASMMLAFVGPLVLTLIVLFWRRIRGLPKRQV
jgi:hypothetical protein